MKRQCDKCRINFDDLDQSSDYPHFLKVSDEELRQRELAESLVGKPLRFAHQPDGEIVYVQAVLHDGMVELKGWAGEFAPHMFKVVE